MTNNFLMLDNDKTSY